MKLENILEEYEKNIDKLVDSGIDLDAAKETAQKMLSEKYSDGTKKEEKALVDIKDCTELYKALYKNKGPVEAFNECANKIKKEKTGVELYNEMNRLVDTAKEDYAKIGKPIRWSHTEKHKNEDGTQTYSTVQYSYSETPEACCNDYKHESIFNNDFHRFLNLLRYM